MNNFKKVGIIFSALVFLAVFTSFKVSHPLNRAKWIPDDFNPKNVTLLIQKHTWNDKYNAGMIKFLEKEYPYKFEVASLEDIQGPNKYQDKKMYQFALVWNTTDSHQAGDHVITYYDLDGHFLDRSIDKVYPASGYGLNRGQTTYKKIISVLVKKFKDGKDD